MILGCLRYMPATAATMSKDDGKVVDGHENDLVMPGFRFHPTEEELIEFYLRRKIEGKRFNVELINFLDLYHYDPWELPALAAIGEKEWFFYVPRDRKYRNGDRPNRVTTSGYWKATGADRMIRSESARPIGLKKTLVFYSGKAPKGIRTSWIMNEYRLPQSETDRLQKAEISLCRVYKRAGVECHGQVPSTPSSRPSGSKEKHDTNHQLTSSKALRGDHSSSSKMMDQMAGGSTQNDIHYHSTAAVVPLNLATSIIEDNGSLINTSSNPTCSLLPPTASLAPAMIDELNKLIDYNQCCNIHQQPNQVHPSPPLLPLNMLPVSVPAISDKHWEWNPLREAGRDYTNFK